MANLPKNHAQEPEGVSIPCAWLLARCRRHPVERLEVAAQKSDYFVGSTRSPDEADAPGARRDDPLRQQARPRHHAAFLQPDRPRRPALPHPPPGDPALRRNADFPERNGRPVRRRFPHAGAGARPPLPRPRAVSRHRPLRLLLPLLHAQPGGERRGRTGTPYRF